ncbi:MAG: hypothetical protein GX237_08085 [Clostridiales bacterium]|nr:hypothetical protein [Clostridiales bacterium]
MTIEKFVECFAELKVINKGTQLDREVTGPYCCDLLSIAMSKMPQGAAWVTVMANVNTLAVATLAEAACIILAEGATLDTDALDKAKEKGVTVLGTHLPVFETALLVYNRINE